MCQTDPTVITDLQKEQLRITVMKGLGSALKFDNMSNGKSDFNQFRRGWYTWAILLRVNRLDLHTQKLILSNCFESKAADRIRPVTDKGLDRECKSLSTFMWILEEQFFPISIKRVLWVPCLVLRQATRPLPDYFNEKESFYQRLFPGGESPASFDKFYSTFLEGISNVLLANSRDWTTIIR